METAKRRIYSEAKSWCHVCLFRYRYLCLLASYAGQLRTRYLCRIRKPIKKRIMPCCCVNTLNFCNVPVCGVLELDLESGLGPLKLILDYMQTQITIDQSEDGSFDVSMLNENFQYIGQVKDEDDNVISFEKDAETYDCIKFKTVLN